MFDVDVLQLTFGEKLHGAMYMDRFGSLLRKAKGDDTRQHNNTRDACGPLPSPAQGSGGLRVGGSEVLCCG
jgi:hypothetical protein